MFTKQVKRLVLLCSFFLFGCTTPFTPDFSGMSSKYALLLEQYQINGLLLNIVRAGNNSPLSFLDIPNINGTGTVSLTPSFGATWYGAGNTIANATPSLYLGGTTVLPMLTFGNSFNFSQSSLDNATFTKGFLSNISLEVMQYFSRHHTPKELMFTLLVDSFEYQVDDAPSQIFTNDPMSDEYSKFQEEMYKLIKYGLTVTTSSGDIKDGSVLSEAQLKKQYGDQYRRVLEGRGVEVKKTSTQQNMYQLLINKDVYRLCMKQNNFFNQARLEFSPDTFCSSVGLNGSDKNAKVGKTKLRLNLRSTFDIFMFLGRIVKMQNSTDPIMVKVPPLDVYLKNKVDPSNQYAVIVVNKNKDTGKSFATVDSLRGDTYSIPEVDAGYSSQVINLLAQLLTLNKIPGSIPNSPAVLIQGGK